MRAYPHTAAPETILPDAQLVERIAALSDRAALAELDARHGMTLYAIAYGLLFDSDAADLAVAVAFREVWRGAASFDGRDGSVRRWLTDLARRAVCDHLQRQVQTGRGELPVPRIVAAVPVPVPPPRRLARVLTRLARTAAVLVMSAALRA